MKNIVNFINESFDSTKFLYILKDVDLNNALSYKEEQAFNKVGVYITRYDKLSCDFYCTTKTGADKLARFLMKYEGTSKMDELDEVFPGIADAVKGIGETLYCVLTDIDISGKFTDNELKKLNEKDVEVAISYGRYSDYTCTFFAKTQDAFKIGLMPWLKEYVNGDETEVFNTFPELARYK